MGEEEECIVETPNNELCAAWGKHPFSVPAAASFADADHERASRAIKTTVEEKSPKKKKPVF